MSDRHSEAATPSSSGRPAPPGEELRTTLDASPLAVIVIDADSRVTYWNGRAETLFGWKAEEVLGRRLPTVPEERQPELDVILERLCRGETFAGYRTRRRRKDGSLVDVAVWTAGRFDRGHFVGTVAFFAPLEDRVLASSLLGSRHEEFQTLVDASPLAVIAIDAEGIVTIWNSEAERLFGWSAAEVLGGPLPHIPERLREEYEGIRERQVAGDVLRGVETRRRRKDGREVEVAIWSASRLDEAGRFLGTVAFVADITDRKEAERRDGLARRRAETLGRVSGALSTAATGQQVLEVLAAEGTRTFEAAGAWVALVDEATDLLRTAVVQGLVGDSSGPASLTARLPAAEVVRTLEPVWIDSAAEYRARYPEAPPPPPGLEACCCLPLVVGERALATVSFYFRGIGALDEKARSLVTAVVAECGRAFEQALLYEEMRSTERRLREANALLRAVADGMEDVLTVKDQAGRYVLANRPAARALGLSDSDAILGKTDHELGPEVPEALAAADRQVLETGKLIVFEQTLDLPSGRRTFLTGKSPLLDPDGGVAGVIGVSTDITERKRVEDELRAAHERLSLAQSAAAAGIWDWWPVERPYWSPEYRELYGFTSGEEPSYERWLAAVHPDDRERVDRSIQQVLAAGEDWNEEFRIVHPSRGVRWVAGRGRLERDAAGHPRRFPGISLDITERKRIEGRLARLHAVTAAVAQAADSLEVGSIIVESARDAFAADGGGLAVADEDGDTVQVIAFTGVPDEVVEGWRTFSRSLNLPFNEVIRTGRPVVLNSPQDVARYPDLVERYRQTGMIVGAYVPLQGPGRTLGALSVTFASPRTLDEDELAFLTTLGREGAVALDRARLYEHERSIAETLQARLLPERLPSLRGFSLAARYLAGGRGLQVGGDWYDAVELPGGELALVVGDVVGHGVEAASAMGQLRTGLRLALLEQEGPVEALASINRLVQVIGAGEVATLACAVVDPVRQEVRHTSAGHPPPLVIAPGREPFFLEGGRSLPLGTVAHPTFHDEVAFLGPGATLILYTDGLIERRGEALDEGLERLRSAVTQAAQTGLDELVEQLIQTLVGSGGSDDVAVLALRREPLPSGNLTLELPADPRELASLRRSLRSFLEEAGVEEEDAFAVTVATSEAAANAIEHAYGPAEATFQVEASAGETEVHIVVSDSGTWREPRHPGRGRGVALMEALMHHVEFVQADPGTQVRLVRRRSRAQVP